MKTNIALGFGLILTTAASGAIAAVPSPTTLIAGSAAETSAKGANSIQCAAGAGLATFQRAARTPGGPIPKALIALPAIAYAPAAPAPTVYYYGMTVMTFTSLGAGTVSFDSDLAKTSLPAGATVGFTDYSQTWVPAQNTLAVKFRLLFSNCTLPVNLLFRAGAPS